MENRRHDDEIEAADAISVLGCDLTRSTTSTSEEKPPSLTASHESVPPIHSYQIKPLLPDKFKAAPVKEIIKNTVHETLSGQIYDVDKVKRWTVDLANDINSKVTELKLKRYKHVVQVTIGENRGAGVRAGMRCLWDAETDGYTSELYTNDTLFCLVIVFAIYLY